MPFIKKVSIDKKIAKKEECIEKLGKYLKGIREGQGYSLRYVAKKADISPSYLSKIENGRFLKTTWICTLLKLSELFGIPVSSLLEEAGFIEKQEGLLPEFSQYLRAKYKLSPQAIHDMEMAKELIENKYAQN